MAFEHKEPASEPADLTTQLDALREHITSLQAQLQQAEQARDAAQDRLYTLWRAYQDLEATLDQRESGLRANLAIYKSYETDYNALARRAAAAEHAIDNMRRSRAWQLIERWWTLKNRLGGR